MLDLAACPPSGTDGDSDFTAVLNVLLATYDGPTQITDVVRQAFYVQADGNWHRLTLLVQSSLRATRGRKQPLTAELVNACGQMLLR
ncbi:hypothetical protein [Enterobacter cloacae]|uniref:hypothetical protein n=1 Tax=Enterobacter cloacae TaxID=550 RepID=UPI00188A2B14|nr:hypothetical protein [Enterobacter cloacae]MBF4114201.1 hypothetical protein [Enterobacter cloacae]